MAARTAAPKIGTFTLDSDNGVTIERLRWRQLKEFQAQGLYKSEGGMTTRDRLSGFEIELAGYVTGADSGTATNRVDDLFRELHNGEQYFQFYNDRRILVALSSSPRTELVRGAAGVVYSWSCRLRSRLPYPESTTATTDNFTPTGAGPHSLTLSSVGGDAPARPTITITTSATVTNKNITITNTSTNKQFLITDISLAIGQSVVIDCENRMLGDGINSPIYPQHISGVFPDLTAGSTPTLEMSHTVGSGASWTIAVSWRDKYFAI